MRLTHLTARLPILARPAVTAVAASPGDSASTPIGALDGRGSGQAGLRAVVKPAVPRGIAARDAHKGMAKRNVAACQLWDAGKRRDWRLHDDDDHPVVGPAVVFLARVPENSVARDEALLDAIRA